MLSATVVLAAPDAVAVDGPLVYGINPFGNTSAADNKGLRPFNPANGFNAPGFVMTNDTDGPLDGAIHSGNGLATDPTTGTDYAIVKLAGVQGRVLATINLTNGVVTTLGDTGLQLAGITFATDGTLYAVSGGGENVDTCRGCLYSLNKTNGAPTFLKQLTNFVNCCGQAIGFNPVDGMIYHTTGDDQEAVLEKIDPTTPAYAITDVGYVDDVPDQIIGIGFDAGSGTFLMTDIDKKVWSVTSGGDATHLSTTSQWLRGLIVEAVPVPANVPPTAVDDTLTTIRDNFPEFIPVLANDIDPEDDPFTITSVTQPANGTVQFFPTGLNYAPDPGYCNDGSPTDDFTYTISNGDTATVQVTVNCLHLALYGFTNNGGDLVGVDRASGEWFLEEELALAGGPVPGDSVNDSRGIAVHPTGGRVFATVNINPANHKALATIDLATAEVTTIRRTGVEIHSLTFGPGGRLFGIDELGVLYRFNTRTGERKLVSTAPSHVDGANHAIAFNPEDGLIYHAAGEIFEALDPSDGFAATDITISGDDPSLVVGLGYDGLTGDFVLTDVDSNGWTVTPDGVASALGNVGADIRGVIVGTPRQITLKYSRNAHAFTGTLTSVDEACSDGRTVSVFRVKRGPDVLIGQDTTSITGVFVIPAAAKPGTYYATVDAELVPGITDCRAVSSRRVRLR